MKKLLAAAGLTLAMVASPAYAAKPLKPPVMEAVSLPDPSAPCDTPSAVVGALDCAGYYSGNFLSNSNFDLQVLAIAELGYMGMTFPYTGTWEDVVKIESTDNPNPLNGNELSFGQTMYGFTVIGSHFGASHTAALGHERGQASVFWLFDFGTEGADSITFTQPQGWSNAGLYITGAPSVPEPSTWLMLLLGFAGIGFTLRRGKGVRGKGELEVLRLLAK